MSKKKLSRRSKSKPAQVESLSDCWQRDPLTHRMLFVPRKRRRVKQQK